MSNEVSHTGVHTIACRQHGTWFCAISTTRLFGEWKLNCQKICLCPLNQFFGKDSGSLSATTVTERVVDKTWRCFRRYSTVVGHMNGKTHIQWYHLLYMKNISLEHLFPWNSFQTVTAKPGYRPNCHLCVKRIRQKRNKTRYEKQKHANQHTIYKNMSECNITKDSIHDLQPL